MTRLQEKYQKEVIPAMIEKFGYKNIMEVPKLEKIVINMGVGEAKENQKVLEAAVNDLTLIAGQKPVLTRAKKSVADDLTEDEIDQIWAEAFELYKAGEKLYFDENVTKLAKIEQSKHSATDERKGVVENFLNKLLPNDWDKKDLYERRTWLDDPLASNGTVLRDSVCIPEIWCECLGKEKNEMTRYNTREINDIMRSLDEWEFTSSTKSFSLYGKQKYYKRKSDLW